MPRNKQSDNFPRKSNFFTHSVKSLEGMGSRSHDLGADLIMHSFTVDCDTFSNEEHVAVVVQ